MSADEAKSRWEDLHSHVITQSAQAFVTSFLVRCLRANIEHMQNDTQTVAALDLARVLPRYKHSQTRLLLVDFEGTLWVRDPAALALRGVFDPPQPALDARVLVLPIPNPESQQRHRRAALVKRVPRVVDELEQLGCAPHQIPERAPALHLAL